MTFRLDVKRPDGSVPKIFTKQQFLAWKFLKEEPKNWSGVIKLANQILAKYPEWEFWKKYDLGFRLNSLAFFLTGAGKDKLYVDYQKFFLEFSPLKEYDLGDKLGEDKEIIKQKGLKEFLENK